MGWQALWRGLGQLGLGAPVQGGRGTCSVFALAGVPECAPAIHGEQGSTLGSEYQTWAAGVSPGRRDGDGSRHQMRVGYLAHGARRAAAHVYRLVFNPALRAGESGHREVEQPPCLTWIKEREVTSEWMDRRVPAVRRVPAPGWPV